MKEFLEQICLTFNELLTENNKLKEDILILEKDKERVAQLEIEYTRKLSKLEREQRTLNSQKNEYDRKLKRLAELELNFENKVKHQAKTLDNIRADLLETASINNKKPDTANNIYKDMAISGNLYNYYKK